MRKVVDYSIVKITHFLFFFILLFSLEIFIYLFFLPEGVDYMHPDLKDGYVSDNKKNNKI